MSNEQTKKKSKNRLHKPKELEKLDSLTDIFSFYTPFDASLSKQTCKWWNGLLSKDNFILQKLTKNTFPLFSKKTEVCFLPEFLSGIPYPDGFFFYKSYPRYMAALLGYIQVLEWSETIFYGKISNTLWNSVIDFFYSSPKARQSFCFNAIPLGYLSVLKWGKNHGYSYAFGSCMIAAEHDQLKILKWLAQNYFEFNPKNNIDYWQFAGWKAAASGSLSILIWLHEKAGPEFAIRSPCWDYSVCERSVNHPHVQSYIHGLPPDERPCNCQV
jgi:hypothetical protein